MSLASTVRFKNHCTGQRPFYRSKTTVLVKNRCTVLVKNLVLVKNRCTVLVKNHFTGQKPMHCTGQKPLHCTGQKPKGNHSRARGQLLIMAQTFVSSKHSSLQPMGLPPLWLSPLCLRMCIRQQKGPHKHISHLSTCRGSRGFNGCRQ